MSVIDGSKLEFKWVGRNVAQADITGGPPGWKILATILETSEWAVVYRDGDETGESVPMWEINITISIGGRALSSDRILTHHADHAQHEEVIRSKTAVIDAAINAARETLQLFLDEASRTLGMTANC